MTAFVGYALIVVNVLAFVLLAVVKIRDWLHPFEIVPCHHRLGDVQHSSGMSWCNHCGEQWDYGDDPPVGQVGVRK